jgi:3-isopropylmalate/(R)-2-methylmalate dehydratase small subunit
MPLFLPDIDTDQIMPKQFLKRVERTGFGDVIFFDWRQDPAFIINDPAFSGSTILVAGPNFGGGSSREHAAWGLQEHGFQAILAPSFGDIFATNCAKIGLLLVTLPKEACSRLAASATLDPGTRVVIDMVADTVAWCDEVVPFHIDAGRKRLLMEGLDEIGIALRQDAHIAAYEAQRPNWMPSLAV